MKKILMMRHGQTLFNKEGLIQGWCDSPLTELGEKQAIEAGQYLKSEKYSVNAFYCSTSERCSDTLELAFPESKEVGYKRLKGLKELSFGRFEAQPEFLHPDFTHLGHPANYYVQHGGESQEQLSNRISDTMSMIAENDESDTILVVSHAGSTMTFLSYVLGKEELPVHIANCGIVEYHYDNGQFEFVRLIDPLEKVVLDKEEIYG